MSKLHPGEPLQLPEIARQGCFYVLPLALLEPILQNLDSRHLDKVLVEADRETALAVERDPRLVGFWDGRLINHDLLREPQRPSRFDIDEATIRWMGWNPAKVKVALEQMDGPYLWIQRGRRAYSGWLACNRQFVAEHNALWAASLTALKRFGIPGMGPAVHDPNCERSLVRTGALRNLLLRFEQFLRRWDLAQLVGPRLPYPFAGQMPRLGPDGGLQAGHGDKAVTTYQASRTAPTLPGELLRRGVEEGLELDGGGPHLREWMRIVAKANTARQTLDRYGRLFALQHYWRVLHGRYSEACRRRQGRLVLVFAEFLRVNEETIQGDLKFLRRQLGAGWYRAAGAAGTVTAPAKSGTRH